MTNEHGTHGSDNADSELIRSLGELPEEVLKELEQLPPEILKTLGEVSPEALNCLTRLPLTSLRQLSGLTAPTLEWLGHVASSGMGELDSDALGQFAQLARTSPNALTQLKAIPPQAIHVLASVPHNVLFSLVELPAELLSQLPAVLRSTGETIEEVPADLQATLDEVPQQLMSSLDQLSPDAVNSLINLDGETLASLGQLDENTVSALSAIPGELLATIAEIPPGIMSTVLELPVDATESLSTLDESVFSSLAASGTAEPSVPQTVFVQLGQMDSVDGPMLGRLAREARSMRDIKEDASVAEASREGTLPELTPEQQAALAAVSESSDADSDEGDTDNGENAGGQTIEDDEGNSQTMVMDDGGREYDDPGATVQSDEFASVDPEGDSNDSFGATVQSDDFSHVGHAPTEDSDDSYAATVQSDEFAPAGDLSDESFDQTVQSDEGWSAEGISAFDEAQPDDEASFDQTMQSEDFGSGARTVGEDEGDSYAATMQSDEGWSEDGLNALDRNEEGDSYSATVQSDSFDGSLSEDDDSYGATVQSDSFEAPPQSDDESFGATVQSDSFEGGVTSAGDDSYDQTVQSGSFDADVTADDDDGYGATIASGVFNKPGGVLDGQLTQEESHLKDAWKDEQPVRTQPERRMGRSTSSPIPGSTLVITTKKLSTKNIADYNKGRRPPEPREPEYELVKVLGEGGMGIVFTARQRSIDRDVALKMLKPKTARDKDQRAKFLSEAVVTGELDHPNIVPIYDVGASADQALFYSMKKVQGTPWLDVIKEKSTSENLDILMRTADAVAFAHSRGVIHRDLKPENTMLGDFGEVLVMDWGLAYSTEEFSKSESITSSTSMGGTPAYMAPEMATGPINKIGPQSDVYLLGAMLFEIVTGRPPHAGKNAMKCLMAAARNQIREPNPENCTKNDPTGELLEIAMKAMETEISNRYQTVQEMQAAIREYQSHRESVTLSTRAAADLKQARETRDYQDFARAVFAYEEAYAMWNGNDAAMEGLIEARFAYASVAEAKGDFDLGMSLLDRTVPEQQEMYARLKAAADERDARQSRIEKMKKIGVGLVASILIIISGATYAVNEQRKEALAQKSIAEEQRGIAEQAKDAAIVAKNEAVKQKGIAEANFNEAEKQRGIAQKNFEEAEIQRKEAVRQEGIARMQKEEADKQRLAAVKARDEAEMQRMLAVKAKEAAEAAAIAEKKAKEEAEAAAIAEKKAKDEAVKAQLAEAAERKKAVAAAIAEKKAKDEAVLAQKKAEEAAIAEKKAKEAAVKAQLAEAEERKKAVIAQKKAEEAAIAEKKAKEAAVKAQLAEAEERKKAVAAKEAEEKAKLAAIAAKDAAVKAQLAEAKARKEAVYQAYVASIGLADSQIRENAFDAALSVLEDPARCPPELRNWEWGRLWHLCNQGKGTFNQNAPIDAIAISPDGTQFVTGGWDGRAVIWDRSTGKEIRSLTHGGDQVLAVDWSADGKWIVTGSNDRRNGYIQLWNASTGERIERQFGSTDGSGESHVGPVLSISFSPDGESIVSGSDDTTVRLWTTATGKHVKLFFSHLGPIWDVEFDREGKRIVSASGDGTAIVWDLTTGASRAPFTGHDGPVYTAAFSPTGPEVATGGYDRRILIWNPGTLSEFNFENLKSPTRKVIPDQDSKAMDGHSAPVRDILFSSDGNQIVSGSDDNTVRLWSLETLKDEKTFRGHNGSVRSLVLADDDSVILTASKDNRIRQWSIDQYAEVRVLHSHVLDEHRAEVLSARFSRDGSRIVTASKDRSALTWESATGKRLAQFAEGHQFLTSSAVVFPDGKRIATAAADNTVRVWDLDSATELFSIQPSGRAAAISVSPDGNWIITGSEGTKAGVETHYSARIWNVQTQQLAFELTGQTPSGYRGHLSEVTAVAISPDGSQALTGDVRGRVLLWDLKTKSVKFDLDGHSPRFKITSVAFHSSGKRALSASFDKTVAQWDLTTGRELPNSILRHGDAVTDMKIRKGDAQAVTTCRDGFVRVWNLASPESPIATLKLDGEPRSISISADGKRAVAAAERPNSLSVIQLEGLEPAASGEVTALAAERTVSLESQRQLGAAVFAPGFGNDRVVVLGGAEARLLDVTTGNVEKTFSPLGVVASANFSTNGKWIVTASWDRTARIWDAQTGTDLRKLSGPNGHQGDVRTAVFSPDAESRFVLTSGEDGRVIVWERESGEVRMTIEGHEAAATDAVFSADGKWILTASEDRTARIWDATSLWEEDASAKAVPKQILSGHTGAVLSASFSADSSAIVTTSDDGSAIVWDTASGKQLYALTGHTAAVTAAAFSPTGDRIVTASHDGTVKIWDARRNTPVESADVAEEDQGSEDETPADSDDSTGRKEILTLVGHSREVTSVTFSPGDGRYILTASVDGKAIVWLTRAWQGEAATVEVRPPEKSAVADVAE